MSRFHLLVSGAVALSLAACGSAEQEMEAAAGPEATETLESDVAVIADSLPQDIDAAVSASWRGSRADRDEWRNPAATLDALQVDPSGTVMEIWPGGGWYADILMPWVNGNGGTYIAAHFPEEGSSENRQRSRERFVERYSNEERYGAYTLASFDHNSGPIVEPGSVDTILTFRNVHNFLMGNYAEKAFTDFYAALREGGTLGVVDHRLPSTREQDPQASSGYVQEAYVIALAEEAGFELVSSSEVNANPADTADHPFGVWTLAPSRRSAPRGEEPAADFDRAGYDAIGESDRMTLLFRKPVSE